MRRTVLTLVGLTLAGAGVASAQQQSRDQLESQLAELRRQIAELQRQLREREDRGAATLTPRAAPRVYTTQPGMPGGRLLMTDNKPKLGVTVDMVKSAARDSIGATLEDVTSDGPAAEAGLKAGDI